MRVLVFGDSAGTGFGSVTRDLGSALLRRGIDLRVLSMNEDAGVHVDPGWPEDLRSRVVLMGHQDGWAALSGMTPEAEAKRQGMLEFARGVYTGSLPDAWTPEAVLFVGDPASFEVSPWVRWLPEGMPALHYVPIEGIGLPPAWAKLWERVRPVAMTEFGADQLERLMGERPHVVYHGVDPSSFWPVSGHRPLVMRTRKGIVRLTSRAECRKFLGWPRHATILFRADRHMPRKQFPAMLRALAPVMARHPSLGLILHCRSLDEGGSLPNEASKYTEDIQSRISTTGHHDRGSGVPRALLTCMYNAADLYISTGAEGFGLTIAESLACGTPAVGLDYSSVPEVIGPAGIVVKWHLIDNIYSYFWARPDEDAYGAAVERLVVDIVERRRLGRLGPAHVAQFDWDVAAARFEALFLGQEPGAQPEVPVLARMAAMGLVSAAG